LKKGKDTKENEEFSKFVCKYLSRAINKVIKNDRMEIEIKTYYNKKSSEPDFYDLHLLEESFDFIDEVYENTYDAKKKPDSISSQYSIKSGRGSNVINFDHLIETTKYKELRKKEIQRELQINIKKPIFCSGLILMESYYKKLEFLNSGAGIFGTHLHGMNVYFKDADFLNLLELKNFINDKTLKQIVDLINFKLRMEDNQKLSLFLPQYIDEIFDMSEKVMEDPDDKIFIRFNTFDDALEAYNILNSNIFRDVYFFN
jgi:hypothetical protein